MISESSRGAASGCSHRRRPWYRFGAGHELRRWGRFCCRSAADVALTPATSATAFSRGYILTPFRGYFALKLISSIRPSFRATSGVLKVLWCGLLTIVLTQSDAKWSIVALGQNTNNLSSIESQRALVDLYCVGCHNDKLKSGGFSWTALDLSH